VNFNIFFKIQSNAVKFNTTSLRCTYRITFFASKDFKILHSGVLCRLITWKFFCRLLICFVIKLQHIQVVVCAGLNESAAARRVLLPAAAAPAKWRRRSAASANRNTRFPTKSKVTQSREAMTWLFDCNFPPPFHYFHCSCWICNCELHWSLLRNLLLVASV